jgi:hypothetical protein
MQILTGFAALVVDFQKLRFLEVPIRKTAKNRKRSFAVSLSIHRGRNGPSRITEETLPAPGWTEKARKVR